MDYLLSREFDAHMVEILCVARSVVIVIIKLISQVLARDATLSFWTTMNCTTKLLRRIT